MLDTNTFLTQLYVMADDFCRTHLPPEPRWGRPVSLTRSEVVTLVLFRQWRLFSSERAFYRFATRHLRPTFPRLPDRSQFNRLKRHHLEALVAFFLHLVRCLEAQRGDYEALDGVAVPVRNARRRGEGWLSEQADIGLGHRIGWYEGFYLLVATNPHGVITGYGFGSASTKDQPLAETFFAGRQTPQPQLPSVGAPARGPYLVDKGFEGQARHQRWREQYGVTVICPPKKQNRVQWPPALHRWVASLRQIVETVNDKLENTFGLGEERPHTLDGFQAGVAAKAALHNFCIWLNEQGGRPRLAFADLLDW